MGFFLLTQLSKNLQKLLTNKNQHSIIKQRFECDKNGILNVVIKRLYKNNEVSGEILRM